MTDLAPYKFITKDELTYLVFTPWDHQNLIHGFTTRVGGVSEGHLSSLNLGFNRGDKKENVIDNYKRVCDVLGVSIDSLVLSKQVHELEIIEVTQKDRGNGIRTPNKWESKDGIYTREKGVTLVTHYADCVPLFFYAPQYDMIGMAHAGWRGTLGEIGKKMIAQWSQEGIPVEAIQVAIGPSIGPCCFEVGHEVAEQFEDRFPGADFIISQAHKEKYHINLWACNEQSLLEAGILNENIIQSKLCTCCHSDLFFSHRKTQGKRGTLGAFMCLK